MQQIIKNTVTPQGVDNFDTEHKTCNFWLWIGVVSLQMGRSLEA